MVWQVERQDAMGGGERLQPGQEDGVVGATRTFFARRALAGGRVESLINGAHRQPLDILRAAHVEFVVSDLDASVAFYGDLLGMIVMQRAADAAHLRGWEESSTTA